MLKERKNVKKFTAFVLSMAMVLTGFGTFPASLKAEASEGQKQAAARITCSEREMKFNDDWKFKLVNKYDIYDDSVQAEGVAYDDSDWDTVELPHDWAIYQEFENGNGVRAAQGALAGGVGWYRKSFTLSDDFKDKEVFIRFDGVYMISQVWINGHTMDDWKQYLGYVTFTYDITQYLNFDGENTIAVKVQSSNSSARWYAGAGIYRNVYLVSTDRLHVPENGVTVKTPLEKINPAVADPYTEIHDLTSAGVDISTEIRNDGSDAVREVTLKSTVYDKTGDVASVETQNVQVAAGETKTVEQSLTVENPKLWSTEEPNLYWVRTEIISGGQTVDTTDTRFGIRYLALNPDSGFYLNGVNTKLNGVCEHSDLGSLGMEVYPAAIERRIRTLKRFGCNAIRTSHNPVSPEFIEACDRLGMLVFEEAFDQWLHSKNSGDYHNYFNKAVNDGTTVVFDKTGDNSAIEIKREDLVSNAERDVKAMAARDKNSPAVFAWSTGNEIDDACYGHGMDTLKMLTGWIKEVDDTRPVAACPPTWYGYGAWNQQEQHLAAAEFSGYNYGHGWYDGAHERYPEMNIFGSETASAFYERGVYSSWSDSNNRVPSEYPTAWNFSSASYSIVNTRKAFVAGEFVWTGHDYLGEPTPRSYPSKSSYFGIVDTAGFAKDAFWLYKSNWTDIPTVHLLPQKWNWQTGEKVKTLVYTNAAKVELFLNGKSLGTKDFNVKTADPAYIDWGWIDYEPGELKAVAMDAEGKVIATDTVYTTDEAKTIELSADRAYIKNDGRDLVYVEADIVDEAGNLVLDADNRITFKVTGGEIVAVDNGDAKDLDPFRGVDNRKAFSGKALAIVKAYEGSEANITVTATAESDTGMLSSNTVTVGTKNELPGDGTGKPEFTGAAEITIGTGVSPEKLLPETVEMVYSNGVLEKFTVTGWDTASLNIKEEGTYEITGSVEGSDQTVRCKIIVKDIAQVQDLSVTTLKNVAPPLPQFVSVEYKDGTTGTAPVTWEDIDAEKYAEEGSFDVKGTISETQMVTAHVAVKEVTSVAVTELETTLGTMPQLPSGVEVTFTDGTKETIGVVWESSQSVVNAAGMAVVKGKILGSDVEAVAKIDVKYQVYASDLEWTETKGLVARDETTGHSRLQARVDQGGPPTLYEKGIGTQADAEVVYDITGKGYESFRANISLGFDFGQGAPGAVVFKVYVDDETEPRYTSPVMTHATKNIPIDVDVKDASRVRLVTEVPAGTEAEADHNVGDWCDAKFVSGNLTVEKVLKMEQPFCYVDQGEVPVPGDTVEVQIDAQHTGLFHIEWPELRADDFMEAGVYEISGKVSGVKDQTVTAIVIVDYNAALADAEAVKKLGAYNMQENFAYVSTPDDKVRLNDIKGITNKSLILYQWTDHMLIENCTTHEYGFDYGVYPSSNSANPEYVIMRAPDMNGFMVRGTSQKHADENFRFYTSADGTTWTEVTNYDKTEDTSREGWPSRIYSSEELPENSNYLKIAFPGSYTWEYNLNSVQIYRGAKKVKLDANGGTMPDGVSGSLLLDSGEAVGELPVPTRNRHAFKGWFTAAEGGVQITEDYVPEESMTIYAQWEKNPEGADDVLIYFVDSGAKAFTDRGQAYINDYADTVRNSVPDQAYDGNWGYTNSETSVGTNGSGDAYTTIRHFNAGYNQQTMTYKFAVAEGYYDIVTGFYDPWSQYANDDRHAKITVTDADSNVLASKADYKISGNKDTVTLSEVRVGSAGNISVNLSPVKNVPSNLDSCDVLVSFIVIIKKADQERNYTVTFEAGNGTEPVVQIIADGTKAVRPEEDPVREGYTFDGWFKDAGCSIAWDFETDVITGNTTIYAGWTKESISDEAAKIGLKTAISIARSLKAEDYTADSYAALAQALAEAKTAYETEGLSAAAIQAKINSLSAAVRGLKAAAKDTNKRLEEQLAEKENLIGQKAEELAEASAEVTRLQTALEEKNGVVTDLRTQLTAKQGEAEDLKTQLSEAKAELEDLQQAAEENAAEIEELRGQIAELEGQLEEINAEVTRLTGAVAGAEAEAGQIETELLEAKARKTLLEAENARLAGEAETLRAAVRKAEEEAKKAQEELERLKNSSTALKKGDTAVVKGVRYRVTDPSGKYAQACGVINKNTKKITMVSSVKINGVTCTVTGIAAKAFANLKKVTGVTISKNVTEIGKQAFYGDKKLRTVRVKGTKLKKVGKSALKKISPKAVIRVPKAKKKAYQKFFAGKGQKKSVTIK